MSNSRLPRTDSIQELAEFWDTHDVTEFEGELEEVTERVFERDADITVHLESNVAKVVREMAWSRGLSGLGTHSRVGTREDSGNVKRSSVQPHKAANNRI